MDRHFYVGEEVREGGRREIELYWSGNMELG